MALSVSYYFRVMAFFFLRSVLCSFCCKFNGKNVSGQRGKACQIAGIMESTVSNGDTGGLKRD